MTVRSSRPPGPRRLPGELPIVTPSLALRAFVPGDAPKVQRMSREDTMRTWLPSQVYRDHEDAASVLASLIAHYDDPGDPALGPYVLGVQARSTGELVGHVGFCPLGEAVEAGFAIEEAHQRKGFATEAVRAACAGFTRLGRRPRRETLKDPARWGHMPGKFE